MITYGGLIVSTLSFFGGKATGNGYFLAEAEGAYYGMGTGLFEFLSFNVDFRFYFLDGDSKDFPRFLGES